MAKKSIPRERLPALQKSYDQLCLWLNYDTDTKHLARRLLDGGNVRPFFREYRRDFLEATRDHRAVQCAELYSWCIATNAFAQPKYASSEMQPNKKDWTALE
jgi:hypothetical protein